MVSENKDVASNDDLLKVINDFKVGTEQVQSIVENMGSNHNQTAAIQTEQHPAKPAASEPTPAM